MAAMLAVLLFALLHAAHAQMMCKGVVSAPNPITSDVTVSGGACTIMGVNVTGSVVVNNGGSLLTSGAVRIFGSINVNNGGSISLGPGTIVSGGVTVFDSEALTIGKAANVGSLKVHNVASTLVSGITALVSTSGPGALTISGGAVNGGGLSRQNAQGSTLLCGAVITGGISLESVQGGLQAVPSATCGASEISGTILVTKGSGDVSITAGMLLGADLIVSEQTGNVMVQDAHLSDITVTNIDGSVTLKSIVADSDGSVTGTSGNLLIKGSSFAGDFSTFGNKGTVTLDGNNFGLEDIAINNNMGKVTVINNVELSFKASENMAGLLIANNQITNAMLTKNKGGTVINNNSFESLDCADNSPSPTGSGNSVIIGKGQCLAF